MIPFAAFPFEVSNTNIGVAINNILNEDEKIPVTKNMVRQGRIQDFGREGGGGIRPCEDRFVIFIFPDYQPLG